MHTIHSVVIQSTRGPLAILDTCYCDQEPCCRTFTLAMCTCGCQGVCKCHQGVLSFVACWCRHCTSPGIWPRCLLHTCATSVMAAGRMMAQARGCPPLSWSWNCGAPRLQVVDASYGRWVPRGGPRTQWGPLSCLPGGRDTPTLKTLPA